MAWRRDGEVRRIPIQVWGDDQMLDGELSLPADPQGIVLFAHGSGGSRHSPRNQFIGRKLEAGGLATLLIDLLTLEEETIDDRTAEYRFNVPALGARLVTIVDWLRRRSDTASLPIGLFGASTGAGVAMVAAAVRPDDIGAVVSHSGRPDLGGAALPKVVAPTLFIVSGQDQAVVQINREAIGQMRGIVKLEIVPEAPQFFEGPLALDRVAGISYDWFIRHLQPAFATRHRAGWAA